MAARGTTLIIAASMAANAALLAIVAVKAPSFLGLGPAGPAGGEHASPGPPPPVNPAPGANTWTALRSDDLKSMAGRLRAAGFPPGVVKAIIASQIEHLFNARRRELLAQVGPRPYWSSLYGNYDHKMMSGLNAVYKEQTRMLKELVGDDQDDPLGNLYRQQMSGGVPREKFDRVQSIISDYNDMRNDVFANANGALLPEDQEKLAFLEREQKADIAAALTPAEQFEYQIRNSPMAGQLRSQMKAFNPTEDEFRSIFKAQQDFDQQYGSPWGPPMTPEQQQERQAHQADLTAQVQGALGPDRFAQYKQETDPSYLQTSGLVERLELPAEATRQVVDVQGDITKRADAVRKDPGLSAADKKSQLAALADEATTKLGSVLGDRGLAAYRQSGGWWIQSLAPPPK